MKTGTLPTTYDPRTVEMARYQQWLRAGYFRAVVDFARPRGSPRGPYVIMLPLPNVTGELHIGHASTFSLQDVLIRWRRMQGRNALWQPGTDHAGIATQNVVERELAKEGLTLEGLGREAFIQRVWEWKRQYGGIIDEQLKRMGFSCDWDRYVFTLDPPYYDAVMEAFLRLYRQGLIYRGTRMVNWCPRDQSAISDLEVEYVEVDAELWYVRYPAADGGPGVVIATQRPETILADVAVAVHPEDPRHRALIGTEVIVPIVNRRVPVIGDRRVDPAFGTGALKITPGHDPLDHEIGAEHGLPTLVILDPRGRMTAEAGRYAGLDRFEARRAVGEELRALGLVEGVESYRTNIGTCDRCHAVIEPYISEQWFCDVSSMAARAAEAIRAGRVRFHHERWAKTVLHFLDHIRPWTISRQLWWGHRIPVWRCGACGERTAVKAAPERCPNCGGSSLTQDPDVLDTWFSSAIWPFATLGWPRETDDLRYFYPGDVLVTANEILFLWVARMIMMGLHFLDDVPFTDVYVAPTVMTLEGRRMSKSLGTGIDPLEMADGRGYGADAVRFALVSRCSQAQQDLRFSEKMIADVRNFTTKIWNATRFVLMNLDGFDHRVAPAPAELTLADRWIRSRFTQVCRQVTAFLEGYEFDKAARALYEFIWAEYCDWYLEMAKADLAAAAPGSARRQASQHTLWSVLAQTMALLHPVMPFLTEEVWQRLPHDGESLMVAPWPSAEEAWLDPEAERRVDLLMQAVRAQRSLRAELQVPPAERTRVYVRCRDGFEGTHYVARLAQTEDPLLLPWEAPAPQPVTPGGRIITEIVTADLHMGTEIRESMVAPARERLRRALQDLEAEAVRLTRRLNDPAFLSRAPAEVVERQRSRAEELQARRRRLEEIVAALGDEGRG
ncbi:MAG: valine--tRNA ligase [Armatimonadota bacterium]|nr:valine--tRNA ligase [Armatimonadota bacterium]MDR7451950.1 valine--tRNA ligase [Armatimonadota bacterium]MDR7466632.1 valine--tRNA ligase [Armatimonadota bacterium]MDR7492894.1 valine--tRNA ligase [Armatimonadota bacterium]MDR7500421.1 valine--tRNA ligase [Armatimonadota bacterium]